MEYWIAMAFVTGRLQPILPEIVVQAGLWIATGIAMERLLKIVPGFVASRQFRIVPVYATALLHWIAIMFVMARQ